MKSERHDQDRFREPIRLLDLAANRERPHALEGFQARLAAKAGLHIFCFCIWLNEQLGRLRLAFADLIARTRRSTAGSLDP